VQFTASAELRDKIARARDLLAHQIPGGELSTIVERAFDLLLEKLERQRLGKTKRLRSTSGTAAQKAAASASTSPSTRRGYVSAAVRREVFERDGEQCTFIDELGRRCPARAFLELDHRTPRALGGTGDATNLSVKCRSHNALAAELVFGRGHIEKRKVGRRKRTLQRGYDDAVAARALRGLGFRDTEVRRALSTLEELWADSPPPLETILREAVRILT